jgi:hypothetical protein
MATDLPKWTIPTSIKDIAVPLPNAKPNLDGLQRAHLLGEQFWAEKLTWLDELLNDGNGFFVGRNQNSNAVLLPESALELR